MVIAGNHELTLDKNFEYLGKNTRQSHLSKHRNCIYLENRGVNIMGLNIYGSPWQPIHIGNGFQLSRGAKLLEKLDLIPNNTDILITHGPPMGYGDITDTQHVGCVDLLDTMRNRVRPKYHLFGHIHEDPGIWTDELTTFINASICNNNYTG